MFLKKNKNVHVIYRHSASNNTYEKERPKWFSHQKCLENFLSSLINVKSSRVRIKLHMLFDGTEEEFYVKSASNFRSLESKIRHSTDVMPVIFFRGGSALASFYKAKEVISSPLIESSDFVYMLENDYVHVEDWVAIVEDILYSKVRFDYLSLYDHGDKYPFSEGFLRRYAELRSKIFVTNLRHWRTAPSTCFSFITKKSTFLEDWPLINIGQPDHVIFRVLREVNRRLILTPVPSVSTHCMQAGIAPVINWEEIISGLREIE